MKKQKCSSRNTTSFETSKPSATEKAGTSPHMRTLKPSEYESLMQDMKEAGRQAKGRFYLDEKGKLWIRPRDPEA